MRGFLAADLLQCRHGPFAHRFGDPRVVLRKTEILGVRVADPQAVDLPAGPPWAARRADQATIGD
jgi:hypothetical protein